MKQKGRKLLPVLLMIWPYVLPFFNFLENEQFMSLVAGLYSVLSVAVCILNIVNAFRYNGEKAYYELALFNILIKAAHIPFYAVMFAIGVVFVFASVVPALLFVAPMVIFYLFVIDVLLLFTSSMYGINAIWKSCREGMITRKAALLNTLLHFCFVTDVLSAVNVYRKVRKQMKCRQASLCGKE